MTAHSKPTEDRHSCGVMMTPETQGKFFYSHQAAQSGVLTRVEVVEVGHTHTKCKYPGGQAFGFATGNCGKGGQNWEVISLELAEQEIRNYWDNELSEKRRELAELEARRDEHLALVQTEKKKVK